MIKFALGIAIAAFSLIVGVYQYFENESMIDARKAALARAIVKKNNLENIQNQISDITKYAIPRGDDKKNQIEKLLGIGRPGLTFNFVGQANRSEQSDVLFKHRFKITGFHDFEEYSRVLRALRNLTGFVVVSTCYGCIKPQKGMEIHKNKHSVSIEGYLYVYDARLI